MKVKPGITLIVHEEDTPVRGNAMASGEDALDKEVEDEILERLERGDVWAWCCVEVKATACGLSASDYLGGCSYSDEKEFREPGGYYDDMVSEAVGCLAERVKSLQGVEIDDTVDTTEVE